MRTVFGFIIGLVTLAAVIIVAVPFLVSTQWIRDQATGAVRERTGRELVIGGDTSFSVFPDISLVVTHATLSNPNGRAGDFADMEELDLGLKLMPLLGGRVEVDRLIVTRPVIRLEIDENGASNWSFARSGAAPAGAGAGAAAPAPAPLSPAETLPAIESVEVGDMRLVDGTVTFDDLRSNNSLELSAINATIRLPSLDDPLDLSGTAVWRGEKLGFHLALTEPRALATGTPSAAMLDIDSSHLKTGFSGTVAAKEGLIAEGDIEVSSPSLKELARWLGSLPPRVDGLGAFSLTAAMAAQKDEITLSSAHLALDGANAEGGFLVSLSGPRPRLQATLAVDRIDVNRYLGGGLAGASAGADGGAAANGSAPPEDAPADPSGWDAEPINVDALGAVDADLRLSTRELLFHDLMAGQSALAVTLRDSILTVDLSELQLYEGRAVGKLTVNGSGEMPAIAASFAVDNVAARQILNAAAGLDWVEGRGHLSGSLASRGLTERRLIEALNGEMTVRFTDGAIRGFNIAQTVRSLQSGAALDWSRTDELRTDFSELSADFTIAKGIAQTNNLQMLGPLVRLTGAGVANLPGRSVDFRINPKVVASIEGQGGESGLGGIEVPFMITGPWDNPSITPDLAAVLRDPQQAVDTIKQIGRSIEELQKGGGGNLGAAIEGLTSGRQPKEFLDLLVGGGGDDGQGGGGQGGGEPTPAPIPEDLFNRLIGQ